MPSRRFFLIGLLLFVLGCNSSSTGPTKESAYERVLRTGVIRAGYVISSPSCFRDPKTGKLAGYSVEVIDEMGRRLGVRIDWAEETTWAAMIEGLKNRFDLVASTSWQNATRSKQALFTEPIIYSGVGIYVKANDHRFDNDLSKINSPSVRIAAVDGELSEVIARADYPQAKLSSLPQLSDYPQLLMEVVTGKADLAFMENNTAVLFLKANPGTLRNININHPVRIFPEAFMVASNEMQFKAMLDGALEELLNEGFVDKVMSRYEQAPGAKYRVALPYRTTGETR